VSIFEHRPGAKLSVPKFLKISSAVSLVRVAFFIRAPRFSDARMAHFADFMKENNDF